MIFNLQMKKSDRYGLAIALSMGSLAGIVGILKAVWAHKLMDARDPQGKSSVTLSSFNSL